MKCRLPRSRDQGPQKNHMHIQMRWLSGKEVKRLPANMNPGLGRFPGGENDNPLQYSCLENPMDRGAWRLQSMESQNQTQLSA